MYTMKTPKFPSPPPAPRSQDAMFVVEQCFPHFPRLYGSPRAEAASWRKRRQFPFMEVLSSLNCSAIPFGLVTLGSPQCTSGIATQCHRGDQKFQAGMLESCSSFLSSSVPLSGITSLVSVHSS